jgi:hypothetical protein
MFLMMALCSPVLYLVRDSEQLLCSCSKLHPSTASPHLEVHHCAGMQLPVEQGHKVTIKQLLDYDNQQNGMQPPSNGGQVEVPLVIQRAMPGLKAAEFMKLRLQTHFLLSWAFVKEAEAINLLRNSLQVLVSRQSRLSVVLVGHN